MNLSDALQGYWLDKKLEFSPHTIESYNRVFDRFIAFTDNRDIEAISSDDIRRFLVHLRSEFDLSRRSVHDAWIPLSSLWTWAEHEMGIAHVLRGKVGAPSFTKKVIEPFTADDVRRLVDEAGTTSAWLTRTGRRTVSKRATALRDRAIILVLVDTGMRASELCSLSVRDYDEQRGRFHIRKGKGRKARFVVAGSGTQKAMWRYMVSRGQLEAMNPLFATRGNRSIDRSNLLHLLKRIGTRSGVANVYIHRFRHTFAINFLRNGGSPILLQELLGHESLETVLNYVKLAEQDIDASNRHSPVDAWQL